MTEQKIESFASWAIVEIMGHKKLAGHVSERVIAGQAFVQVDVPEYAMRDGVKVLAFTQFFGPSSIYCITPCTEETARRAADSFRARPVEYLDLTRPALPAPFGSSADDDTIGADDDQEGD